MPAISPADLIARLRAAADPATDRDLLRAFLATRSEPAFAALVRRHGPLVLGVCRRVLGNPHDADDAFQATFLVLARKASAVGHPDRLPGWLHTIAVRTATEIRRMRDRRRKLEASGGRQPPECAPHSPEQSELATILDEELSKLPEHYRVPVVLCELQGLPRKEAAARLRLAEGTLSSRLAKARKLLADRLTRRGVTASAATITAVLTREASARVPAVLAVEAARVALMSAASAVAVHAADGVVKALLVTKLKGLAVAVGVVVACAGGAATLSVGTRAAAGGPAQPAAAGVGEEEGARGLVKQLGSPNFADRERAEKKLRALGTKAKPAVLAGTKSPDPEVARRCVTIREAIRRDQLWAAFARVAGDDKPAHDLFTQIMANPRAVNALEAALDDPSRTNELYRIRTAELLRVAGGHPPVPLGDVAGWLFLGALQSGTTAWATVTHEDWASRLSSHFPFLPEDDYTSAKPIAEAYTAATAGPLKKLTAAWLAKRRENDGLRAGLALAIRYDIADAVAAARTVLGDPKPATISPWNLAAAAVLVGLHGTKADLPPLVRHTADHRVYSTILNLPPGTDLRFAPTEAKDGRDLVCQVRDAAVVAMCRLAARNPADFGFPPFPATKHPNDRPMSLTIATAIGFNATAARAAAFKKAAAWLTSFEPPPAPKPDPEAEKLVKQLGSPAFADRDAAEKKLKELGAKAKPAVLAGTKDADPEVARRSEAILKAIRAEEEKTFVAGMSELNNPVWKRFKELVGDTKAARKLYLQMIDDYRRATLLTEAEANPAKAAEIYAAEVARASATGMKAFGPFVGQPAGNNRALRNESLKAVHLGDVVAILFLGARPMPDGSKDPSASWAFRASFADGAGGSLKEPFRKLFAAWLERRTDPETIEAGLKTALYVGIPEALPIARRLAADPKLSAPTERLALLIIGNHGTRDDLPLMSACRADARATTNQRFELQVRDVAAAMALHLYGQDFEKFGFQAIPWQVWWLPSNPAPFKTPNRFITAKTRDAAHKKAWEWIDKQPKPEPKPKKEDPDPEAAKLVEQLGSPAFADRDAAEKKLKELGAKAKPAVAAGTKSADPEVARRCRAIHDHLRREEHWPRFARLIGDDAASRKLFDEMVADSRRLEVLEQAAADPDAAGKLYAAEIERAYNLFHTGVPIGGRPYVMNKGGKPAELGFLWPLTVKHRPTTDLGDITHHGFPDAKSRDTAHKQAKAWLARKQSDR